MFIISWNDYRTDAMSGVEVPGIRIGRRENLSQPNPFWRK
jgi:hypothetical protein